MEVIRQDKFTLYRLPNSFKNSNTFVILPHDSHAAWLVDIGDFKRVIEVIGNRVIEGVFLTHSHFDHIVGIKDVCCNFPHCRLYGSELCLEYLENDRRNLSFYYDMPLKFHHDYKVALTQFDKIFLASEVSVERIFTPGHTPDSVTYRIGNLLFTGDSFIPGVPPVTKLKGGNISDYQNSVNIIKQLITQETHICPGHGPNFKYNQLLEFI